ASVNNSHEVIVAVPITDRSSKTIVGVVRVTEARSVVDSHVFRAWAVMTAAAIAALLVAWAVASLLANKLARPLLRLASNAATLGDGGIVLGGPHTGINELDQLDAALTASSERLAALLARERAFSSDVSHQLRTPLTRLRLQLETLDNSEGSTAALGEVDGLQATIDHLLALSRDRLPVGEAMSVQDAVGAAATRWKARVGESRRLLQVDITPTLLPIRASRTAFDQILDVLIDNAVVHGLGTIELVARRIPGGVAVDVGNPGPAISANEHDKIFERGYGNGNGIGLALARSVAEADGGRLVLSSTAPPRFSLIYVT
ncbi:MAG: HAMP domain-containing sensor histidine kinase, partial [Ilumatobacteraceae bacterium]